MPDHAAVAVGEPIGSGRTLLFGTAQVGAEAVACPLGGIAHRPVRAAAGRHLDALKRRAAAAGNASPFERRTPAAAVLSPGAPYSWSAPADGAADRNSAAGGTRNG